MIRINRLVFRDTIKLLTPSNIRRLDINSNQSPNEKPPSPKGIKSSPAVAILFTLQREMQTSASCCQNKQPQYYLTKQQKTFGL